MGIGSHNYYSVPKSWTKSNRLFLWTSLSLTLITVTHECVNQSLKSKFLAACFSIQSVDSQPWLHIRISWGLFLSFFFFYMPPILRPTRVSDLISWGWSQASVIVTSFPVISMYSQLRMTSLTFLSPHLQNGTDNNICVIWELNEIIYIKF